MTIGKKWIAAFICGMLLSNLSHGQQDKALTYTAHKYLQSEQHLETILDKGTHKELDQYLAENFTARDPSTSSFEKHQWLKQQLMRARQGWLISDIEVQIFDDINIVSFRRVSSKTSQQQFIVDVWRDSQKKLLSRFESSPWSSEKGPRQILKENPNIHIKPDGKG